MKQEIKIDIADFNVLQNIAEKNNINVNEIIGLLMDGYLQSLVIANEWKCDYILANGNPWKSKSIIKKKSNYGDLHY